MDACSDSATDTDNETTEAFGVSEEQYDRTLSLTTRRHGYRGRHEFLADRLEAYSDAIFAIVGTILIAYLRHIVPPDEPNVSIRDEAISNIPLFAVYHFTFFHLAIIWLNHSRIFSIIERVDDILIWLNMLLLYVVSFVPLAFGILGKYRDTYEGILIPSVTLVVVNVIMIIIIWYAFRRERFLHIEVPKSQYTLVRWIMYSNLLFSPLFVVLAIGLGTISLLVGQICFYLSAVMLIAPRLVFYMYQKVCRKDTNHQLVQVLSFHVLKERTEFFTDGIYAIVATLVILEITIDGIPSREIVNEEYGGNLFNALLENHLAYITHLTTFMVISLLWFVHHSLFNFVRKLNPLMLVVHLLSCSLVGVIPPVIELLSVSFGGENEATAMRIASMIIAVVGIFQLVLLSLLYFTDRECVDPMLFHNKSSLLLCLKATIVPVICIISYWCSLGTPEFRKYSFYTLYLCTPLIFIVMYIAVRSRRLHSFFVFCWRVQKRSTRQQRRMNKSDKMEIEMKHNGQKESD